MEPVLLKSMSASSTDAALAVRERLKIMVRAIARAKSLLNFIIGTLLISNFLMIVMDGF